MTRLEAIQWAREQDEQSELDNVDLDEACRALGYDPDYLRGDDQDPTDRRWDVICAEVTS